MVAVHHCHTQKYPFHPPNNPSELQADGTFAKFIFPVPIILDSHLPLKGQGSAERVIPMAVAKATAISVHLTMSLTCVIYS